MVPIAIMGIGFGLFTVSSFAISSAAWPKLTMGYKVVTSLLFGAILLLVNSFILTPGGISLAGFAILAFIWFVMGYAGDFLFNKGGRSRISEKLAGTPIDRYGLKEAVFIATIIMIIVAFLLMPLLINLSDNLLWRYRAYMIVLVAIGLIGFLIRTKLRTFLVGFALLVLLSLALWMAGMYPVGTPLLEASSVIGEGFKADVSMFDIEGVQMVLDLLTPLSLAADVIVAVLTSAFIAISAVVLINALIAKGSARTILALFLVLLLLIPGLLIPYVYSLGVGGLEFGGSIGIGAMRGLEMVDSVQNEELSEELIQDLQTDLISAGESFQRSEVLLTGLEKLGLFGFVGAIPTVGKYSSTGRSICWGLTNGAMGLQTSALGILEILLGVLTIFNGTELTDIGSFDVLGPRIMEEKLDERLVASGMMIIDSAFAQVRSGFPQIRRSLDNLSEVDSSVFADTLPDVQSGLDELLQNSRELEIGIDIADVFLGEISNPTPATHFLFAAYSIAAIAPNLTDLRDVNALPSFDSVVNNLSFVSMALEDPVVVQIRQEGGDAGDSVSFVADAIDLIEVMAGMGDKALVLAADVDDMREKFEGKSVYNYTQAELLLWKSEASSLTVYAEDLSDTIDLIEGKIDGMVQNSLGKRYGYANDLARGSVDMLKEVLTFLRELRGIVGLTYGIESLVSAAESFNHVYYDMIDLERQIIADNMAGARQTAAEVKIEVREGRIYGEDLLERLEEMTEQIQLPFAAEEIESIVDTAADIELRISVLQTTLADEDGDAALDQLGEIKGMLADLSEEFQIE